MSDSEKDEKENEKPYPKDSKVKGEEEEDDFPNKENDINDNNFPEEENDIDNGQKQSINNNNNISNDENENENDFNNNGQENNEENIQDNTFPEKEENKNDDLIEQDNQENNENNNKDSINNKKEEEKIDDFNEENNNNNKENSFRFSNENERNSKEASHGPLNINSKENEFEYEDDNKNENNNNDFNNNNSFGFRDSDLKNSANNNFNNNQYENDFNNNKNQNENNNINDNFRNSANSDGMNINNNNENESPNKFNSFNPYEDNNNKNINNKNTNINNKSNNNNFNYAKNPYTSSNNNTNNNIYNNNNNNNNNNYNNNNNNRNPNGGFGYNPSSNINQNINQTTSNFIPQDSPITNKLNNYNYTSSYPIPANTSSHSDYDPFYERFEQNPEDSDGFDIDPSHKGKDSSTTAGIQIANTIMGAGILSIPLVMSYLGILIGAVLLLFLAITTIYSVYILMRCHQITGKSGYSMFGKITMGPIGAILVKFIIIVNNMGICIVYLRIFGEVFQTIFQSFVSKNSWFMTNWHNFFFILIGSIIMFFFIFIKNISSLKKVSYLGVIAVLVFTILMVVLLLYKTIASELDSDVSWRFLFPDCTFPEAFHAAPTVFLAFLFQFNVFPIYYSLKNRGMRSMFRATKIGVTLSLIIFLVVGIIGFLLYGFYDNYDDDNYKEVYGEPNNDTATYDTILDKLNDDMILYKGYNVFVVIVIIIICVAFVITCLASFPILFLSLRVNYVNSLEVCRRAKDTDSQHVQITQGSYEKRRHTTMSRKALIIVTIVLYLFMVAIAILIYNIKTMFHIIGTIAGTFIAFILPNIFYIRIVKMSGKNYSLVLPFIMLIIGILFFVLFLIMSFFES